MTQSVVTLKDLARAADVSLATASLALADSPQISAATKQRVRAMKKRMKYQPLRKRSVKAKADETLTCSLVIVDDHHDRSDAFARQMQIFADISMRSRIRLVLTAVRREALSVRRRLIDEVAGQSDGLLLYGRVDQSLLLHVRSVGVAAVVLGGVEGDPYAPLPFGCFVTSDHFGMGVYATGHLIAAGHKRIGFICGDAPQGLWYERWLAGYRHAMSIAGLPAGDEAQLVQPGEPGGPIGEIAAQRFTAMTDKPTAWVVPDPYFAMRFLEAMRGFGCEPAPENIVIGSATHELKRYDFEGHPLILEDLELLTRTSLAVLRGMMDDSDMVVSKLMVPFQTRGMHASR